MSANTKTTAAQAKADEKAARALALSAKPGTPIITPEEAARLQLVQRASVLHQKAVELSGLSPSEFDALSEGERSSFVDAAAEALEEEKGKMPALGASPKADLVRVTKDGDTLDIHPDALDQHLHLGWKLIQS